MAEFDTLIRCGTVVDGTGAPAFTATFAGDACTGATPGRLLR